MCGQFLDFNFLFEQDISHDSKILIIQEFLSLKTVCFFSTDNAS